VTETDRLTKELVETVVLPEQIRNIIPRKSQDTVYTRPLSQSFIKKLVAEDVELCGEDLDNKVILYSLLNHGVKYCIDPTQLFFIDSNLCT